MATETSTVAPARRRASYALEVAADLSRRGARRIATAGPTLAGDRAIEYGFCVARIPDGNGRGLDFGSGTGNLSVPAAERGWDVTAFDRMAIELDVVHPRVHQLRGDVLQHDFG